MNFDPIADPQAEDTFSIGGVVSPGIIPPGGISGAEREHKYDVKEGKGTVGSTTTFTNKPPVKFSIKMLLWLSAHFVAWNTFLPLLKYDPTKKAAQAFDLYHPALAEIDVRSVVTTKIGARVHEGNGLYSVTVEFMEYLPASKTSAVSTPNGSQANAPGWVEQKPGDPDQAAIATLQKQADDLSKQAQAAA